MNRPRSSKLVVAGLLLGLACDANDDDELSAHDAARLCESAEEKLTDCFSVEVAFVPCNGDRAQEVLAKSCVQIVEDLAQPKSDDPDEWFCTTFPEVCERCETDPAECA